MCVFQERYNYFEIVLLRISYCVEVKTGAKLRIECFVIHFTSHYIYLANASVKSDVGLRQIACFMLRSSGLG